MAMSVRLAAVSSAREALAFLEERASEVAIVVSDLKMPEMLGSDFLLEAKARWPDLVTILLSGFSETSELTKAIQAGIFSYILKPWEPAYLQSELAKALEVFRVKAQNKAYIKLIEEELKWAGEMQRALLQPRLAKAEGMEFISSYRPVKGLYCGGDYYDIIALEPGRYVLLLGDVAGHGLRAAFITGILKAVIYPEYVRVASKRFSPAAFLGWLNDRMNFELRKASNVTISFLAILIDKAEMKATYANAGHPRPILLRQGSARELEASGPGIGFSDAIHYEEETLSLEKDDLVIAFTDGLTELGAKEEGGEVRGIGEVLEGLGYDRDLPARLMGKVLEAAGRDEFEDDVAILAARIL